MNIQEDRLYPFTPVDLTINDFPSEGFILDIGGGGEGVIGQLKGRNVAAIDLYQSELEEAAEGPLKIIMDARDLKFLDASFGTATAFFSLMYIAKREDQLKILQEAWRVLKPGGSLHLWDVDLAERPNTDKEIYLLYLNYVIRGERHQTGYGQLWPEVPRGKQHYIELAEEAGFKLISEEINQNTFYLVFKKE